MSGRASGLFRLPSNSIFTSLYVDFSIFWESLTSVKDATVYFLDNFTLRLSFNDYIMILTLFAVYGGEIQVLIEDKSTDPIFEALFSICLFSFIFELLATSFAKTSLHSLYPLKYDGFLFSFFFFLDLASIISLFPDIGWIADGLGIRSASDVTDNSNITRAGRVVRLVRLIRLVRLYNIATTKRAQEREKSELLKLVEHGLLDYDDVLKQRALNDRRKSKLGAKLSSSITKKITLMVLIIFIGSALLFYRNNDDPALYAITNLHQYNINPDISNATKWAALQRTIIMTDRGNTPKTYLVRLVMSPFVADYAFNDQKLFDSLRMRDMRQVRLLSNVSGTEVETLGFFTDRLYARRAAILSIILTFFVAFCIVGGVLRFTADTERLVLYPIERMMNMVEAVAKNPLAVFEFGDHKNRGPRRTYVRLSTTEPEEGSVGGSRRASFIHGEGLGGGRYGQEHGNEGEYETRILESTIQKVTALLRVGFGEAGAGIISTNLSRVDHQVIDPLLPGVRVYAIFGFCDIHGFEDVNRKLGKAVLTFVNTIADIVHEGVHTWGGQCNKNLGNAFVIVWRIGDEETLMEANYASILTRTKNPAMGMGKGGMGMGGVGRGAGPRANSLQEEEEESEDEHESRNRRHFTVDLKRVPGIDNIAESALIGYLKVIAELNRSAKVLAYRVDKRLTSRRSAAAADAEHTSNAIVRTVAANAKIAVYQRKLRDILTIDSVQNQIGLAALFSSGSAENLTEVQAEMEAEAAVAAAEAAKAAELGDGEEKEGGVGVGVGASGKGVRARQISDDSGSEDPYQLAFTTSSEGAGKGVVFGKSRSSTSGTSDLELEYEIRDNSYDIIPVDADAPPPPRTLRMHVPSSLPSSRPPPESPERRGRLRSHDSGSNWSMGSATPGTGRGRLESSGGGGDSGPGTEAGTPSVKGRKGMSLLQRQITVELEIDFKVRMGFGLHAGWAIEGAVGSLAKVDATYLSPHVNMAARLETASRQYGVPLLASHLFHELLSQQVQGRCRRVDVVTVKGSDMPIGVYTYDCYQDQLFQRRQDEPLRLTQGVLSTLLGTPEERTRRDSIFVDESLHGSVHETVAGGSIQGEPGAGTGAGLGAGVGVARAAGAGAAGLGVEVGVGLGAGVGPGSTISLSPLSSRAEGRLFGLFTRPSTAGPSIAEHASHLSLAPRQEMASPTARRANKRSSIASNLSGTTGSSSSSNTSKGHGLSMSMRSLSMTATESRLLHQVVQGKSNDELSQLSATASPAARAIAAAVAESRLALANKQGKRLGPHSPKHSAYEDRQQASEKAYEAAQVARAKLFPEARKFRPPQYDSVEVLLHDVDLLQLRAHVTDDFTTAFQAGVEQYLRGDWPTARKLLERADEIMKVSLENLLLSPLTGLQKGGEEDLGDGPSRTLLRYMGASDFTVPADWAGFRPLTSK